MRVLCETLLASILVLCIVIPNPKCDAAASILESIGVGNIDSISSNVIDKAKRLFQDGSECVKSLTSASEISARFSPAMLGALCGKRVSWLKDSENRFQLLMNDPGKTLTRKQRSWLFQVQDCSDLSSCICPGGKCPGMDLLDDAIKNIDSLTETVSGSSLDSLNKQITGLKDSFGLGGLLGDGGRRKGNNNNNNSRNTGGKRERNSANNRGRGNGRNKRQVSGGPAPGKVLRREYRMMSDSDRIRLQLALNRLKTDLVDGVSKYDLLVLYHTPTQSPGAHWGPAFLPWHRELLKQLEVSLRAYDPQVYMPYWDSSLDSGLPNAADSVLWTEKFMGNGNGYVTTGPFASWVTQHKVLEENRIVRYIGQSPFGSLYKPQDFDVIGQKQRFADLTSCVDPYFELLHGTVHMWVGGHMGDMPVSPNDPSFFFHHVFVDYLWETWRMTHQSSQQREQDYVGQSQACSQYHYANTTMIPFPIRNIDGLSNKYTQNFYGYQPRPFCTRDAKMTCHSQYLFCDSRNARCLSKVVAGGNCTGFEGTDICYESTCINGLCNAVSTPPPFRAGETPPPTFAPRTTANIRRTSPAPPRLPPQFTTGRPFVTTSRQPQTTRVFFEQTVGFYPIDDVVPVQELGVFEFRPDNSFSQRFQSTTTQRPFIQSFNNAPPVRRGRVNTATQSIFRPVPRTRFTFESFTTTPLPVLVPPQFLERALQVSPFVRMPDGSFRRVKLVRLGSNNPTQNGDQRVGFEFDVNRG